MAGILFALYGARQGDGPAVQQQLFGQGGFARVRVGDYGKRSSFFNLFNISGQVYFLLLFIRVDTVNFIHFFYTLNNLPFP